MQILFVLETIAAGSASKAEVTPVKSSSLAIFTVPSGRDLALMSHTGFSICTPSFCMCIWRPEVNFWCLHHPLLKQYICMYTYVYLSMSKHATKARGQLWFSSSTIWVPAIELWPSGTATSTFTCLAISSVAHGLGF